HAFVLAPELAEAGFGLESQVGSGPFTWLEWRENEFVSLARNPEYFTGDGRPFLDGITMIQPSDAVELEALLRTRRLDLAFLSRTQADRLIEGIPDLVESAVGDARYWGMRFQQTVRPYDDVRV